MLLVAVTPAPRARAISPRQKSCTPGVPSPPTWRSTLPTRRACGRRALGRVGGMDRGPGGEHLELAHLREPGGPLGLGRGGQEAGRVEVEEGRWSWGRTLAVATDSQTADLERESTCRMTVFERVWEAPIDPPPASRQWENIPPG